MRRTRKRLIEVIDGLNDLVVPLGPNLALRKCANLLEDLWNPPPAKFITTLMYWRDHQKTSWYIKDLLQDALWHLKWAPWSGPNAP